jgi:hypothetical protein
MLLMLVLLMPALIAAAPAQAPPRFTTVTLHIFNRVFASFHDKIKISLKEEVRVGDTEYTAQLVQYVPEFDMDLKSHKVVTRSQQPKNPAFQVIVRKNGAPQDTAWAFMNMAPHYTRKSLLAFIATKIEFANAPAMVSQDTLAQRIMKRDGETH